MLNDPISSTQPMVSLCLNASAQSWMVGNTIESVLTQIHWNWELFVIDNGEDELVQQRLDYYTRRYPDRVTVIPASANDHASDATPSFLQLARGQYYLFLAPDDVMPPHRITEQLAFLNDNPGTSVTRNVAVPTKVEVNNVEFSDDEAIIAVDNLDSLMDGINLRAGQSLLVQADQFTALSAEDKTECTESEEHGTVAAATA